MKTTLITAIIILFTHFCLAQDFWVEISRPLNEGVFAVLIDAELNLITAMGNYEGVYLSDDQGETWMQIGLDGIAVYSLHIDQTGNIFAGTGGFNNLYLMENTEEEWLPLISGIGNVSSIMNASSGSLFIGGWTGIYMSTDFGITWEQVLEFDIDGTYVRAIKEGPDGVLFAGITAFFGGGGVYRSYDNGNTWEYAGLNNKFISSLAFNSHGDLFAGSSGSYDDSGSGVFISKDLGSSWDPLAFNRVTSLAIDPNDVLYAGCTHSGVIRSIDNGESWELIVSGMGDYPDVDGISLSPDGYLYAYSRWSLHRSAEPVYSPNSIFIHEKIDFKLFPNPFSEYLIIELPYNQYLYKSFPLKVLDFNGRLVYSQSIDSKKTIDLSFLKPGIYYVTLSDGMRQLTKPILKH